MSDNKTPVVVGVDGSPGAINGAQWAAAVAEKYETSLHIVHATPSLGRNLSDSAAAIMAAAMSYQRDMAEIFLREAATTVAAKHPTLRVTTESTHTPADEALIQLSETARMVVLGSPPVTPAGALFIGSTTLAVATHASCPVVAWRGPHTAPTDGSIVVGVDGSHSSAVALGAAFDFADRFAAKIAAVRSWSMRRPAAAVTIPFLIDWDALEAVELTQLTDVVDGCNQRHPDVTASCFIETTGPSAALLQHSAEAQLVVVGSRGRSALTSAILGSTGLNLLHHCTVPVMVCPAAG